MSVAEARLITASVQGPSFRNPKRREQIGLAVLLVCAAAVAIVLVAAPLGANCFTLSTTQDGTNPQSGPVANDPMATSRQLLAAKEGRPTWASQIAFGSAPVSTVSDLLRSTENEQTWAAATYSAQNAAVYQLESGQPVVALGGWQGTDPAPTLPQFQKLVADSRIGFFIWQQELLDKSELSSEAKEISQRVDDYFTEQVIDGVHLYDFRG
jgi:hypothetical protein